MLEVVHASRARSTTVPDKSHPRRTHRDCRYRNAGHIIDLEDGCQRNFTQAVLDPAHDQSRDRGLLLSCHWAER